MRDTNSKLEPHLFTDEKILWSGHPISRFAHAKPHILVSILLVPLLAVLLLALLGAGDLGTSDLGISDLGTSDLETGSLGEVAPQDPAGSAEPSITWMLWLFMLAGAYQALKPLIAALVSPQITYGLTDRRVMIVNKFSAEELVAYPLLEIENISSDIGADGTGNIIVAEIKPKIWSLDRKVEKIGFIGIADAKTVEDKVKAAKMAFLNNDE